MAVSLAVRVWRLCVNAESLLEVVALDRLASGGPRRGTELPDAPVEARLRRASRLGEDATVINPARWTEPQDQTAQDPQLVGMAADPPASADPISSPRRQLEASHFPLRSVVFFFLTQSAARKSQPLLLKHGQLWRPDEPVQQACHRVRRPGLAGKFRKRVLIAHENASAD